MCAQEKKANPSKPAESASDQLAISFASSKILILIIVVGIVLAIFAGMRSVPNQGPTDEGDGYFFSTVKSFGPWLLALFLIYFFVFRQLGIQTPASVFQFNDAVYLTDMNRLGEAEAKLKELEPRWKKNESLKHTLRSQLALIEFERGNFTSACDIYQELLSTDLIKNDGLKQIYWTYVGTLAQLAALSGDTPLAESTLELGRGCFMIEKQGALLRAQVILLTRKKDYAGAVHLAQQDWRLADTAAASYQRNRYRVVWAFALQQLDAQKNAEQIAYLVAGVKPFWKGQFYPLTHNWPEMEAFLAQHKLSDDYATA